MPDCSESPSKKMVLGPPTNEETARWDEVVSTTATVPTPATVKSYSWLSYLVYYFDHTSNSTSHILFEISSGFYPPWISYITKCQLRVTLQLPINLNQIAVLSFGSSPLFPHPQCLGFARVSMLLSSKLSHPIKASLSRQKLLF